MTNFKYSKKVLMSSVVAILVCCMILIASTFAWFNDSVTSSGNKIMSGTLKIDLELLDQNGRWSSIKDIKAPIFDYDKWEPGYTDVKVLKVENEGTLALKWKAKFVSQEELGILADVIDVYVLPSENELTYPDTRDLESLGYVNVGTVRDFVNTIEETTTGTLTAAGTDGSVAYLGIALKMRENVGNEYQGQDLGAFDIMILATQLSSEDDAFDNGFDANAKYPAVEVVTARGSVSGINWTLTNMGTLTVSPSTTSSPDANSGKIFEPGVWREAVVYDKNGTALKEAYNAPNATPDEGGYFCDRNAVTSLVIKEGVTSIGTFAAQFPNLTGEVIIPASVTYIGQEAFMKCHITKLTFAEGGTEPLCIAPGAFKNLDIEEVVFPSDRPEIHIHCWAFNNCKSLKRVTLSANITTFSKWTHVDYCGMNYVNGSDSQIFNGCTALESITFANQTVHDKFFAAPNNTKNINAIGNVKIIINT